MSQSTLGPPVPLANTGMNSEMWLAATDAPAMLDHLFPRGSPDSIFPDPRKSWLYLLACARLSWNRLPWIMRTLVDVAELLPDRYPIEERVKSAARTAAEELFQNPDPMEGLIEAEQSFAGVQTRPPNAVQPVPEGKAWTGLSHLIFYLFSSEMPLFRRIPDEFHSAELVREIFGNPFARVPFEKDWKTSDVKAMARAIYWKKDFGSMPILGDALQEAGCDDDDVLNHCRGTSSHVRGCWVLDGLLDPAERREIKPRN